MSNWVWLQIKKHIYSLLTSNKHVLLALKQSKKHMEEKSNNNKRMIHATLIVILERFITSIGLKM